MGKNRLVYYISEEPVGLTYQALIGAGMKPGASFGFVIRQDEELSERGRAVLRQLKPYLTEDKLTNEWPGTRLSGSTACVLSYVLSSETLRVLTGVATSLYEWQHPELPEDLFVVDVHGKVWLTTVAHEGEAFLDIDEDEVLELRDVAPRLKLEPGEVFWDEPEVD